MAPSPSSCTWSARQYILAALIGTQVAVAISIVYSVIHSPAHIYFSIANATTVYGGPDNKDLFYNFTLVSNNISPHTAVQYKAINLEIWYSETGWSPAEVDEPPRGWQPPRNTTNIPVKAEYFQYDVGNMSRPEMPSSPGGFLVVVIAQAKFKFGPATTSPYGVRVFCRSVHFDNKTSNVMVNCTG